MKTLVCVGVLLVGLLAGPVFAGTLPAQLVWTNPDMNDALQIEKAPAVNGVFVTIAQPAAGTSSFTDATNAPGDTACYRVAYFNSSGVGPYAGPVCKTFPALPTQAPGALQVR